GRLLPGLLGEFAETHAGRPLSIVGEPIWATRTPAEYAAAVQHEALVNLAFADQWVTALCPYDRSALDAAVLADAERTHPVLCTLERSWTSPAYADPARLAREIGPVGEAPADARSLYFDGRTLAGVREAVETFGVEHGLAAARAEELRLAAHEIATNSVTHAGGRGRVRLWCDGGRVVCEIADEGCFVDDLAGRLPAPPDAISGRGLLLANFLCDLVEVGRAETGTTVRLHVSREGGA
ncbi:MAG TPA: anti-sigma factor RsbA family regulatory protein, partial [Actinopolymorphaceae bacterium]